MLEKLDLTRALPKAEYRRRLRELQRRLHRLQRICWKEGLGVVILFEGWDAAGKGSSIRRLTERLEPRGFELYPIRAARTLERSMPWLWRFWIKVPVYGSFAIFDRSWYGRVLVERVEGEAPDKGWPLVFQEINHFERLLADDRYVLVKFFLHIDAAEQERRFELLEGDPLTAWHVEPEDWARHEKYAAYLAATEEMLEHTETEWAPWTIVPATDKYWTRIQVLQATVDSVEAGLLARDMPLPDEDDEGAGDEEES